MKPYNRIRSLRPFWSVLLAGVVAVLLVAGLHPKGYGFRNEVEWTSDGPGIKFGPYGIAFTRPFISAEVADSLAASGFTIEILFDHPPDRGGHGFGILACFHAGDDARQLLLGTWRDQFIVMNGDDYSYERKKPRITIGMEAAPPKQRRVSVVAGPSKTAVFLDGVLIDEKPGLSLKLPGGGGDGGGGAGEGRLVIGNSVYGTQSCLTTVRGFGLYRGGASGTGGGIMADSDLGSHDSHDPRDRGSSPRSAGDGATPLVAFRFDDGSGTMVSDHSPRRIDLQIPPRTSFLEKRLIAVPDEGISFNRDFFLNLIGFVPFGFVLSAVLRGSVAGLQGHPWRLLGAVASAGFLFSLGIEITQAWLPSRSSSLLDLALNSAGALIGGAVSIQTVTHFQSLSRR